MEGFCKMTKTLIRLLAIFMVIVLCACLFVGCGPTVENETKEENASMFVCVEKTGTYAWMIVYHKETKVMYAVSQGYYNCGNFTVLLNPDGTPMIWEGK